MFPTIIQGRRRMKDRLLCEIKHLGDVQGDLGRAFDDRLDLLLSKIR